jgi:glyoxylase-like metal-dependent hydrolase (beta-lactamase superfamily II)
VFATEFEAAMQRKGFFGRFYEPAHWKHGPHWCIHDKTETSDWFGLESIHIEQISNPEVRFVPLPGHTKGHCGVAIADDEGWLLHAGDATYPFYADTDPLPPLKPLPPYVLDPPGYLEKMITGEQTQRLRSLLRENRDRLRIICSNDSITYSKLKERSINSSRLAEAD